MTRQIVGELFPDWLQSDRVLSQSEYEYSREIIASLCETDPRMKNETLRGADMFSLYMQRQIAARALEQAGYRGASVVAISQCERCPVGYFLHIDGGPEGQDPSFPEIDLAVPVGDDGPDGSQVSFRELMIRLAQAEHEAGQSPWEVSLYSRTYRYELIAGAMRP